MKENKHILDNKMTYIDFINMTQTLSIDLEEQLNLMEGILKFVPNYEIHYEIY